MQQPNNGRLHAPQDLQAARRLAESNATTKHFLGACPRPWMTTAAAVPRLAAERYVLQSNDTSIPGSLLRPGVSETVQNTTGGHDQSQGGERSQSARNQEISSPVELLPAIHNSGDGASERRLDIPGLQPHAGQASTSQHIEQPGVISPVPPPETGRGVDTLLSTQSSSVNPLQRIITSALHSLNMFPTSIGSMSKIEGQRFSLLRVACVQNDSFYLCLHQIFCVSFIDPRRTTVTGFGQEQYAGLNLLTLILLSNQDMSVQVLRFFAELPAPLEILMRDSSAQRDIVTQVGVFLKRFATGWDWLRTKCFARRFPPFVEELVLVFEVHSPVLRRVLFNSIHRQLGATDDATWSKQGLLLFDDNQAQYQARTRNLGDSGIRSKTAILMEQKLLGEQYKVLCERAATSTVQSGPRERLGSDTRSRPHPLSHLSNQAPSGNLSSHPAPISTPHGTSSGHHTGDMQWPLVQNPLSRSQSASTLTINTQYASLVATGPFPASGTQRSLSGSMNPPSHTGHSSPERVQNSPVSAAGEGGQQPVLQRRRGRPPLSDRSVRPHTTPSASHHGGRGSPIGPVCRATHINSHHLGAQMTSQPSLFIPTVGLEPIQTSYPNPDRVALHQAYLRSPTTEKLDMVGQTSINLRLYQYLSAFAIPPHVLDSGTALFSWDFLVTLPELCKRAVDTTTSDGHIKRLMSDGCLLYRLRSVEVAYGIDVVQEAEWSVQDTSWPPCCFVRINDIDIELRRKLHHGKDLAVDLTPHVREGTNTITVALLHNLEKPKAKGCAMAVEVLEVGDSTRVDSAPSMLPADESLRSITQGLAVSHSKVADNDDDDEVQVVDSHISIDLLDPFMATIFDIPARGKTCTHRECFDLQTFFQTRNSRIKDGPISPDEWKCPICKKDARPQSLVVDGFLKSVRDSLVSSSAAADARAILIGSDGSWVLKTEGPDTTRKTREDSSATVTESSPLTRATVTGNMSRSDSTVIEIDDD